MRVILLICVLFVVNGWSLPVDESVPIQTDIIEQPEINNEETLLEIDSQQGHENESGRQARQFGIGGFGIGFSGGFGGLGHGYGGYGGGYPLYGGGYGGYPYYGGYGGYGHHHHRHGFGYYG